MLFLPSNTPDYLIRTELVIPHLEVKIMKLAVSWWLKLCDMGESRYPKLCFLRLLALHESQADPQYNWASQMSAVFQKYGDDRTWEDQHYLGFNKSGFLDRIRRFWWNVDGDCVDRSSFNPIYKIYRPDRNILPFYLNSDLGIHMKRLLVQMQAFFLVLDDVVDESTHRRGRPCWHQLPEVGLKAVCHSLLIEGALYKLLKKYLSGTEAYLPIVELFHSMTLLTTLGQVLDCNTSNQSEVFFDKINMERYNFITTHKTAYYTFYLPVATAMYLAGMFNPEQHRQAKSILVKIGRYFQVQDDYLDVFGEEVETGKVGTDIQDGKCSWLAVVALQRASAKQEEIFKEHFGKVGKDHVKAIKDLYIEMGLPGLYSIYEQETYNMINTHIQQLSAGLPHDLFFGLLDRIHKRSK